MGYTVDSVDTHGFKMPYIKFGTGSKTLVILPGLSLFSVTASAALIEKQYGIFCNDFTVYLFERREEIPEAYSIYDMADDTARAMQALGISEAALFGASQGGMIAMAIAVRYPSLVNALILASTACSSRGREDAVGRWITLAKQGRAEELCLSFGEKVYPKAVFEQNRDAFVNMARLAGESELKRFAVLAQAIEGFDVRGELASLKIPVLVISDTQDEVFSVDAALELTNAFSHNPLAVHYEYSGYAHAVYDTAPDFAQRMYAFLSE